MKLPEFVYRLVTQTRRLFSKMSLAGRVGISDVTIHGIWLQPHSNVEWMVREDYRCIPSSPLENSYSICTYLFSKYLIILRNDFALGDTFEKLCWKKEQNHHLRMSLRVGMFFFTAAPHPATLGNCQVWLATGRAPLFLLFSLGLAQKLLRCGSTPKGAKFRYKWQRCGGFKGKGWPRCMIMMPRIWPQNCDSKCHFLSPLRWS